MRTPAITARALTGLAVGLILVVSASAQSQQVIYSLGIAPADGAGPMAGLVFDKAGNLYGTTALGHGHGLDPHGSGTVFKLKRSGGAWAETVLHTFSGADGAVPTASVVLDERGDLYGTTTQGGAHNYGVVFKLSHSASGWKEQVLYNFTGLNDGSFPYAGVIRDAAGNLYGTTKLGGVHGKGTVFELTHGPSGWTEKVLHSFGFKGKYPYGGLIFDTAGNLYGTTKAGGTANLGVVFKLVRSKNDTWNTNVLYSFLGATASNMDGKSPFGSLVFDGHGNLYGTTLAGGLFNDGIIFQLTPSSDGSWIERVLHHGGDGLGAGRNFLGGLVIDTSDRIYGTSLRGGTYDNGVVFRLTPTATGLWKDRALHAFTGVNDGGTPLAGVVLDAHGNIYGTTYTGGEAGNGTVFEIAVLTKGR